MKKKRYCRTLYPAARRLVDDGTPRARMAIQNKYAWEPGDTVTYWFYDNPKRWVGKRSEMDAVRRAFAVWKAVGINLDFAEVADRKRADLRIGFDYDDDSYSALGYDCRSWKRGPTMNFGVNVVKEFDTALHEIGHALGFPHEHQNPNAGIVWDEEAVYAWYADPPNEWDRPGTFENIIQKFEMRGHEASAWDPNSIMHYDFDAGLILEPPRFRKGLTPKGGLSARDRKMARQFYP